MKHWIYSIKARTVYDIVVENSEEAAASVAIAATSDHQSEANDIAQALCNLEQSRSTDPEDTFTTRFES